MDRIIAVDYGDARTGIAVSDLTGTMAGETLTIQEWNPERLAQRLAFFAGERGAVRFVLGLPRNMDGTEGPRAEKARQFAAMLEKESGPRHSARGREKRKKAPRQRGRGDRLSPFGELSRQSEMT